MLWGDNQVSDFQSTVNSPIAGGDLLYGFNECAFILGSGAFYLFILFLIPGYLGPIRQVNRTCPLNTVATSGINTFSPRLLKASSSSPRQLAPHQTV